MAEGPTRGAGENDTRSWGSRPGLARAVKIFTVLLPIVAAVGLSTFVGPSLWRPDGLAGTGLWLIQLAALSTATVVVVDRFARRLVPLAGLLNLSMVFPDEAPSRFGMALKAGTTKRLRAELEERPADETVNDAATRLLGMVTDLNNHDRLTRGHTERVRAYSDLIAEEMGLEDEDRWKLRWAVLLHDIGKLTVPTEILNKNGKPSDEEWQILRNHPAAGAEMVEPLADWLGDWRRSAGEHHERWDGNGYPNKLAGAEISLAGRIVAVADAYDVITSARSYKRPTDPAVAREELVRCAGSQFDPQVVRAFVNVSLGRLRLVGGPLAWLASLPWAGNLPGALAAAAGNAAVAASVVAATVVGGVAALPAARNTQLVQTAAASVSPADHGGRPAGKVKGGGGGSGNSSGSNSSDNGSSGGGSNGDGGGSGKSDGGGASGSDVAGNGSGSKADGSGTDLGSSTGSGDSGGSGGSTGSDGTASGGTDGGGGTTTSDATTTTAAHAQATTTTRPATTTTRPATTTTRAATTTTVAPTTTVAVGPTVRTDTFTVVNYTQTDLNVLANDSPGTTAIVPSSITITVAPGKANNYSINSDFTIRYRSKLLTLAGTDSFQYRVCDQGGRCATATVNLNIALL